MPRIMAIAALSCMSPGAAATYYRDSRVFLGTDMQPKLIAKTLAHVEDEWRSEAWAYIECEQTESGDDAIRDCDGTPGSFSKSCVTVVDAIVKGSSGDPNVMREYMVDVCRQETMGNWHRSGCVSLAKDVSAKMTASTYDNRVRFPSSQICEEFWGHFLEEQKPLREQEMAAKKELEEKVTAAKSEAVKKAQERAMRDERDVAEALTGDVAKEEGELEAEREEVALRSNRSIDRSMPLKEAQVEGVVEAAEEKIQEATRVEEDDFDAPEQAARAAATTRSIDRSMPPREAQVEGVVKAAEEKIQEATRVEEEARDAPEQAARAAATKIGDVAHPGVETVAPRAKTNAILVEDLAKNVVYPRETPSVNAVLEKTRASLQGNPIQAPLISNTFANVSTAKTQQIAQVATGKSPLRAKAISETGNVQH